MSEKGIRELAEQFRQKKFGSKYVDGWEDDFAAVFAESIVEQCAQVADEHADKNRKFSEGFDKRDQQVMVDRALANKAEAERIAKDIRSRWQRGEGQ